MQPSDLHHMRQGHLYGVWSARHRSTGPCQPTSAARAAASPDMRCAISVMPQQLFDDVATIVRAADRFIHHTNRSSRAT